jgi:hypothetical protein
MGCKSSQGVRVIWSRLSKYSSHRPDRIPDPLFRAVKNIIAVKMLRLRKLSKMQTVNDGTRSFIESVINPELIVALRDWAKSTDSGVSIGGLGLSFHCKLHYTGDIHCLFLEPSDVLNVVRGFSRVGSSFRHDRTGIAVDIFTPASINIPRVIVEQVFQTAMLSDCWRARPVWCPSSSSVKITK